nr:unnamed protein product [Digitaria exilis]
MVYTACAVFLYGGISDHPLPPLTAHRSERAREGTRPREYGLRGGLALEAGADDVERVEGRDGGEASGRSCRGVLPRPRLRPASPARGGPFTYAPRFVPPRPPPDCSVREVDCRIAGARAWTNGEAW